MDISNENIKFTFYLDGNKYIVYSLEEEISLDSDLYFAKEVKGTSYYESIKGVEYDKVLQEYSEYLKFSEGGEESEN